MLGSKLFVKALEDSGIDTAFGLLGDLETAVSKDFGESKIRFYHVRCEKDAGFMAAVYGRLKSKPALAFSTLGPGAMNMVGSLANAMQDRDPVVAISFQLPESKFHPDTHQFIDLKKLFEPVTKYCDIIRSTEEIEYKIDKAVRISTKERPGSVHLSVPVNILTEEALDYKKIKSPPIQPTRNSLSELGILLESIYDSKFPICVVGGPARGASEQLNDFIGNTNIFAFSTFLGKGCVSADNSHYLGVLSRHSPNAKKALSKSDLIVLVGYDRIEGIEPEMFQNGEAKKIISVDVVKNTSPECFRPDVEIIGDLKNIFDELNIHLKGRMKKYGVKQNELFVERIYPEDMYTTYPIKPEFVMKALNETRSDSIIATDVGWHKQYVGIFFDAKYPNQVICSNGLSHMGFGLPAALAAKVVQPEKDVVAVVGDGGFQMSMGELETSKRYGIPVTVIIFDDGELGLVKSMQEKRYGKSFGTQINNPDYVKLAEAYGFKGYRIKSAKELFSVLNRNVNPKKSIIIDVPITYENVPWV